MNKIKLATIASVMMCATTVTANNYDYATVTSVKANYSNYTTRTPYQDCYTKQVRQNIQGDGSITNELIGGLLGGAIGNQFGKGDGRDAMTGVGAILGASIAHDGENQGYRTVNQDVCETRYRNVSESQLDDYLVGFDYEGRSYSARTKRGGIREGDSIKVRINIAPIF
ncbi:MAG: hypothetical protein Ctma_0254 [Catillopecten margaritatus gill symbiont]|uniref:Glycine zipper 2TM domain-containing protein n=1 Tax=Catillopecten margaritatus gill symbiont TaxID=3083288 RepID=A0AAU6PFL4_9GAMM